MILSLVESSALIVSATSGSHPTNTQFSCAFGFPDSVFSPLYFGVSSFNDNSLNVVLPSTSSVKSPCSPFLYTTVNSSSSSGISLLFLSSLKNTFNTNDPFPFTIPVKSSVLLVSNVYFSFVGVLSSSVTDTSVSV